MTESAGAFGSKDDFQSLSNDLNAIERPPLVRRDRVETLAASKEAELARLRTQVQKLQTARATASAQENRGRRHRTEEACPRRKYRGLPSRPPPSRLRRPAPATPPPRIRRFLGARTCHTRPGLRARAPALPRKKRYSLKIKLFHRGTPRLASGVYVIGCDGFRVGTEAWAANHFPSVWQRENPIIGVRHESDGGSIRFE